MFLLDQAYHLRTPHHVFWLLSQHPHLKTASYFWPSHSPQPHLTLSCLPNPFSVPSTRNFLPSSFPLISYFHYGSALMPPFWGCGRPIHPQLDLIICYLLPHFLKIVLMLLKARGSSLGEHNSVNLDQDRIWARKVYYFQQVRRTLGRVLKAVTPWIHKENHFY